jgi:hypothetical protein
MRWETSLSRIDRCVGSDSVSVRSRINLQLYSYHYSRGFNERGFVALVYGVCRLVMDPLKGPMDVTR